MFGRKSTTCIFRIIPIISAFLLLSACYSPPFQRTELVPLGDIDPEAVAEDFEDRLPASYSVENTIIFRFFRNETAALGYAAVDRENESFEIICLNHMGLQLFHISGDEDGNHLVEAIPEFKEQPGFADAVGEDIRRIYFDLTPDDSAESRVHRDRVTFERSEDDKTVEYVFGGEKGTLLKKRARTRWRVQWEVTFYEYFTKFGNSSEFVFPRGVVLHNRRHRYRLIIRTRSVDL